MEAAGIEPATQIAQTHRPSDRARQRERHRTRPSIVRAPSRVTADGAREQSITQAPARAGDARSTSTRQPGSGSRIRRLRRLLQCRSRTTIPPSEPASSPAARRETATLMPAKARSDVRRSAQAVSSRRGLRRAAPRRVVSARQASRRSARDSLEQLGIRAPPRRQRRCRREPRAKGVEFSLGLPFSSCHSSQDAALCLFLPRLRGGSAAAQTPDRSGDQDEGRLSHAPVYAGE